MFAHILSLIIQNRFHLLLKLLLLSIRNSWSDVLSAPLFVAAVSFFVARAKFQVGVLAGRSRSRGFSVWKIFPCEDLQSAFLCLLFCSICMRDQFFMNTLVIDGIAFSRILPRKKKCAVTSNYCMTPWYSQVKVSAASLQLARINARSRL